MHLLLSEGSIEDYEEFISKYEDKELHPNHYHLAAAKHSLMQMLGRNEGYLIQDLPMNLVIITQGLNVIMVILIPCLRFRFSRSLYIKSVYCYESANVIIFVSK
jgi:hypothetical protein